MNNTKIFWKQFWPAFIPVILLNIIAINQLFLSNYDYLTTWKGGGFGMFADISERFPHVHLINRGAIQCAEIHYDFDYELLKLNKYPKSSDLKNLAKKLTKNTWVLKTKELNRKKVAGVWMIGKNETLYQHDVPTRFSAIEILIFDIKFNKNEFLLTPKLINSGMSKK